ncbi:MAG: hypothetical protein M3259_05755 [Actinomycetota bacterium]|nr:hypothetical protein [Actinomycetota bacterium]
MNEKDANRMNEATEELAEAAQESYKAAVDRAFAAQEGSTRLARSFFEDWVDTLQDQAELNRRTVHSLAELAREQREAFRELSRESLDAYDGFLDSLSSYYKEVLGEPEEEPGDQR